MKTSVPNDLVKPVDYVPFEASRYPLPEAISAEQHAAIRTIRQRADWTHLSTHVPELFHPLRDIARRSSTSSHACVVRAIARLLKHVYDSQRPYWLWSEAQWRAHLTGSSLAARPYLTAVAYHLGPIRQPQRLPYARQPSVYAMTIFGEAFVKQELARLEAVLVALGYSASSQSRTLSKVLGLLMLENGDPRLESLTEALLRREQANRTESISRNVGMVSHGLAALGILERPLRMRSYVGWREKSTQGIDPQWVHWCKRWRDTSTLRPRTKESTYSLILRTGLWLAQTHPEVRTPETWQMSTCAAFIAAVDQLHVGDWSLDSAPSKGATRYGQPIRTNSKHSFLHSMRRFFIDVELWGWGRLQFRPRHHLATPRTVSFASGVNPRVIDDAIWLKLVWASLNLTRADLLCEIHYPLAMVQAMAVLWTHAGLRRNEIARLSIDCAQAQTQDVVEEGQTVPAGTLCYLQVPPSKTFKAYVKPVAVLVKDKIDAWLQQRPSEQAALWDERTGEKVRYLFQYRGKRPGKTVINDTIIPMLCAKAGVPLADSRGRITSHRGRASTVTALASVPRGMSLVELMQWSGHTSPTSTLHYVRIRPTQLAAAFVKADQMAHMISLLVDHDVIARQSGDPYLYYDLGNSYCTNPFWSTCAHRMACIGCDFNLPKASAKGQALESKASVRRYLEEVPLTADERAIVEGDQEKIEGFIRKLEGVPALDGHTTR